MMMNQHSFLAWTLAINKLDHSNLKRMAFKLSSFHENVQIDLPGSSHVHCYLFQMLFWFRLKASIVSVKIELV